LDGEGKLAGIDDLAEIRSGYDLSDDNPELEDIRRFLNGSCAGGMIFASCHLSQQESPLV